MNNAGGIIEVVWRHSEFRIEWATRKSIYKDKGTVLDGIIKIGIFWSKSHLFHCIDSFPQSHQITFERNEERWVIFWMHAWTSFCGETRGNRHDRRMTSKIILAAKSSADFLPPTHIQGVAVWTDFFQATDRATYYTSVYNALLAIIIEGPLSKNLTFLGSILFFMLIKPLIFETFFETTDRGRIARKIQILSLCFLWYRKPREAPMFCLLEK